MRRYLTTATVVVAGLWVLTATINAYIMAPASVLGVLMADLEIGETSAGWIISVALGAQMVASIPVGIGLDRRDNRAVVLVGISLFVIACAMGWYAGLLGDYPLLLVSRVFGGIALVIVWNAGATLIGHLVPPARQATAIALYASSAPAGFAIGQVGGPPISSAFGWPAVFGIFGVFAVAAFVVFWISSRTYTPATVEMKTPQRADITRVLLSRPVWHVGALAFLSFSLYVFLNSWMPTYLVTEMGVSMALSGLFVAAFAGIGIVSRASSGALSDYAFDRRRRPVVLLSLGVALPALVALSLTRRLALFVVLLLCCGFFIQLGISLYFAYVRELVEGNVTGTAISFVTAIGVSGAFSAPIIAGALIERTGGYELAFAYAISLGVIGTVLATRAPEPVRS